MPLRLPSLVHGTVYTLARRQYSHSRTLIAHTHHLQPSRLLQSLHRLSIRTYASDVEDLKALDALATDSSALLTGVIDVSKGSEVVLFYDHIYPLSLSKYGLQFFKYTLFFRDYYDQDTIIKRLWSVSLPQGSPLPNGVKVEEYVPLKRDGGAFVKFCVPLPLDPNEVAKQIVNNVTKAKSSLKSWDYFRYVIWNTYPKCFPVKGTPWIEDLRRYPSARLKIKFEGEVMSEEELYLLFRRYGPIVDIIPVLSTQAFATVIFSHIRSAVAAKNCITGFSVELMKTLLHIQYIPQKRVNYIANFIVEHQRILIPIIVAILAAIAVVVFDPIRQWFIEQKLTHSYSFLTYKDNRVVQLFYLPYKTVQNWITDLYDYIDSKILSNNEFAELAKQDFSGDSGSDEDDLWYERYEKAKQLKLWIYENNSTFIVVKGPKGAGKSEFVLENSLATDPVLKKQILYIDCETIVKSRTENEMLRSLAHQLGYFPLFTWASLISSFVDLAVQSVTGQKLGLSELKEQQVKNMFLLSIPALRNVALKDYDSYMNAVLRRKRQLEKSNQESPDGETVIEDTLLKEDQYLQQHPEFKPVIVINKFLKKSDSQYDFIYQMIAEWAASAVQANVANVIFITHDVGSLPVLTDALPNQVFKSITLLDALKNALLKYVWSQLDSNKFSGSKGAISDALDPIGGRMLDLQAFVRRMKSGEDPELALLEMVSQAAEQITTFFLNRQTGTAEVNWLAAQVWVVMKLLSEKEEIPFGELSKNPLLKPLLETLQTLVTLEKHDVILLKREKGVVMSVLTGRPIFRAAFKTLTSDSRVSNIYDNDYYGTLIQLESAKISKFEDELAKIKHLASLNLLKLRIEYIQLKIGASTDKITEYETIVANLGKKKAHETSWTLKIIGGS